MKRTYIITAAVCCAIILAASFTDPIHDAASNGNLAGVQAELDKGVDVNLKTNIGVTPLHRAAFAGHKEVIELLIAKGADVNAQGITGGTPLIRRLVKITPKPPTYSANTAARRVKN